MQDQRIAAIDRLSRQHRNNPQIGSRRAVVKQLEIPTVRERECRYDSCGQTPIGDTNAPIDLCREHLGQAWHLINALRVAA